MTRYRIKYYIPENTYQYTKLTYKKEKKPESVNDGTIVNLDPTTTEIILQDLDEKTKYWFTIYTDISESESVDYTTGENGPEENFIIYKNGQILRPDNIAPTFYVQEQNPDKAVNNVIYAQDSIEADTYVYNRILDMYDLTLCFNRTSSSQYGPTYPLLYTNSIAPGKAYFNTLRITFDIEVEMSAYDTLTQENSMAPTFEIIDLRNNYTTYLNYYIGKYLPDKTYVVQHPDNPDYYIIKSSDGSGFTFKQTAVVDLPYADTGDMISSGVITRSGYPQLLYWVSSRMSDASLSQHIKLNIKQIEVILNKFSYPKEDDEFDVHCTYLVNSRRYFVVQRWKVSEIMNAVKNAGYNSFVLSLNSMSSQYAYCVIPINLALRDDIYIIKDQYVNVASSSSIGIYPAEGDSDYSSLNRYYFSNTEKELSDYSSSFPFQYDVTVNNKTYKCRKYGSINTTTDGYSGFVFYTSIKYNRLYFNNMLLKTNQ